MYFSEIEKCIFSNCEMYLSKIVKCICLKLQNVFVFYCNTNVFVQNGGMYLFQIAKCTCLKLQNLFVKKFLVFMQIGIWSVLLAHLWTAFQSCYSGASLGNFQRAVFRGRVHWRWFVFNTFPLRKMDGSPISLKLGLWLSRLKMKEQTKGN